MAALQLLINTILNSYFINTSCLINIYEHNQQNIINNLENNINLNNYPQYTLNFKNPTDLTLNYLPECQDFVLNVKNLTTIKTIERYLRLNSTYRYNSRKYLIILNEDININEYFKQNLFTFISNVLVIKYSRLETEILNNKLNFFNNSFNNQYFELWTHNYHEKRGNNQGILLNKWFTQNATFLLDGIDLYPNRHLKQQKFKGRKFVNAFVHNPPYIYINKFVKMGSEYNAMKEFAKYYNMTFVDLEFDIWGDFTDDWNATIDSVKSSFLVDEIDVYYSSALLTTPSIHYASLSNPYMRMSIKCLVPEPKEQNDWLLALNIKSYKFWFLLLTSYMAFGVLIFYQKKLSNDSWNFNPLELFGITLSQAVADNHLPNNTLMRLTLVKLLLLSIIFATIYNSHMSSLITIPTYVGKISTIKDMIQHDLKWSAPTTGYAIPLADIKKKLHDLFFLSTKPELLQMIEHKTYMGFGFIELTSRYYNLKTLNSPQLEDYDVLDEDLIVDFTYFHLRKNSVLLEPINSFLTLVMESGLHIYWEIQSYLLNDDLHSFALLQDDVETILRPLNLDKLKGHFVVLFAGLLVAAIRFGYELKVKHYHNQNVYEVNEDNFTFLL